MAKSATRKAATPKAQARPSQRPGAGQPGPTPVLEWVAAAVGLVVLVATIGFVGSEALRPDDTPPQMVEGELKGEGEIQTAEASFDFIADHSSREGGLFFEGDPRRGELTLRAKGYAAP